MNDSRDAEIPVVVHWGAHMGDVRLFRAIPRIGDTVRYNYFDQPTAEYTVEHVMHHAHDPKAEDGEDGWAKPGRPVVDIYVIRSDGRRG